MKISSEQLFSLEKLRQITWGCEIYPFPGKQWVFLGLFQTHGKNFLIKNMVHTCLIQENPHKCVKFFGKMQEINILEANMVSFQDISVKYLPFPHPGISFMAKDLSQIKLYTYFNIGDVETLVKLNEKKVNSPGVVHILIFQQI